MEKYHTHHATWRPMEALATLLGACLLVVASSCSREAALTSSVEYMPPMLPIAVSVDGNGAISVEIAGSISTPIGSFSARTPLASIDRSKSALVVRLNGIDTAYSLDGSDYEVSFDSGYYERITLEKRGKVLLLELRRIIVGEWEGELSRMPGQTAYARDNDYDKVRQDWNGWSVRVKFLKKNTEYLGEFLFGGAHLGTVENVRIDGRTLTFVGQPPIIGEFDFSLNVEGEIFSGVATDLGSTPQIRYAIRFSPTDLMSRKSWYNRAGFRHPKEGKGK